MSYDEEEAISIEELEIRANAQLQRWLNLLADRVYADGLAYSQNVVATEKAFKAYSETLDVLRRRRTE